ncbi:formin-J-like isoform X2 [Dendronephthya gigantea]|uniref:formin-J-like isoform X2 n=1 Tax=Dendronephthya gigantea TaxID=151771 RepID=UPI00106A3BE6|nr:formin-J-like isoform X2 [Dendronephthya gigantea]
MFFNPSTKRKKKATPFGFSDKKSIEYQLPQLGLPNDAKTSQNTTLTNLATSQKAALQGAQNTGSFYSSFFAAGNNPSVVQNSKNHGFSSRQPMVSPNALSFPSENINIPSLATSNASLLQFTPNMVGQNTSLTNQLCVPSMQNSSNIINDDVSPFDDSADLIEGPLDKIVDQIMDRQISERESSSFDDDTPVITYSNRQAKAPQLASTMSSSNVPSRSVLSPNAPSRNVTSPNVPSPNIPMHSIPSPNAPTHQVPSPSNHAQNILSPNPQSRNILVQNITTTKIIPPSISPPNIPSQNTVSQSGLQPNTAHVFSTIQGLSSQASEKNISSQSHPKFRQSSVAVPSSMVNTLGHNTTKDPSPSGLSFGQGDLTTNNLFQSSPGQRNSQSYPNFLLQNSNQTLIQQPSVTFSQSNQQSKPYWPQNGNNLDDLLRMQESIRTSSPNVEQAEFGNQLARSSPNFTSVLTNKIVTEQSQNNVPSFITTNIPTVRPATLFQDVNDITNDSHLKISAVSSTANSTNLNVAGAQNMSQDILQFSNRTTESNPKSVSNQVQTTYPVHNFPSNIVLSSLPGSQNENPSLRQREVLVATQPLTSPRQQTSTNGNQFFVQNSSDLNQASELNRGDGLFSSVSQPLNVVSNSSSTQGKLGVTVETPSQSEQNKPVFTLVSSANTSQVISTPQATFFQSQANSISKPAGITTIKITSPGTNTAGFKYPTIGFSPNPAQPKAVSMQPPRALAVRLRNIANPTTSAFPTFRLRQANMATSTNSPNTKPVVFTLAPGSQSALKALPNNLKDKLAGRQVIFLQQPSGQPINTPKPQPMKIVFVNDGSIGQLVSGPVKSKAPISSVPTVVSASQTPGLTVSSNMIQSPTDGKRSPPTLADHVQDAGSPSSVNSADSDVIPIASLKHDESFNKQLNETNDVAEHRRRGKKRRKDPNRPVKPLSSFQRFFQATQPTLRQQNPQATFAEVSKSIKAMWENLSSKDKKVYQDAWRLERVQYKKAMEEYNASFNEIDLVDAPSPKLMKSETKDDLATVPPVDIHLKTENISIKKENISSPTLSSSTTSSATSGTMPAPRSTGKPLAMMAEMANKTKMASAQAAAATKAMGMTKSLHSGKNKPSNGVDDSLVHVAKKKAKINPIPKKLCIRSHCSKPAKTTKERGTMFCSDDCIMKYCRGVFKSWVETRRQTLKGAT